MKIKERVNLNKFYKTNPSGISLIVLVITIIVIIILAAAVIITLTNNNPISEANKARFQNDRDNMQSVFTNTVAKVMAKNQGNIKIEAGNLNSVTSGENSVVGEAKYTIENSANSSNTSGKIIFDNKSNTETEYYTGNKLPIYKAGETTWSVNEEGIIMLSIGNTNISEDNETDGESGSNTGGGSGISQEKYDDLVKQISDMKKEIKEQSTMITNQNEKINKLETETILNKRENLANPDLVVPLTQSWTEKDFGTITLSKSVDEYKYLEINTEIIADNKLIDKKTTLIAVDILEKCEQTNWYNGSIFHFASSVGHDYVVGGHLKNDKILNVRIAYTTDSRSTSVKIKSIYGIK